MMYCLASFSFAPQEAIRLQLFQSSIVLKSDRSQSRHVRYHNTLITIIELIKSICECQLNLHRSSLQIDLVLEQSFVY